MISTKGRYALRVMLDLAQQDPNCFTPLDEIASRQGISKKYLEIILKVLVQEKLLKGLRGKGGGYRLTHPPETYTVGSILRLTEGSLAPVTCLEHMECPRMGECRTLNMWRDLHKLINDFFDHITIADLMESGTDGNDYVI